MPQQDSKAPSKAQATGNRSPGAPAEAPEFISEGTRLEIEQNGKALDVFTGKWLTQADVDAFQSRFLDNWAAERNSNRKQ